MLNSGKLVWHDDAHLTVNGVNFYVTCKDFQTQSTGDRFVYLKPKAGIEQQLALFRQVEPRRVLEFGVWEGGSVVFLDQVLHPDRLVAVDIRQAGSVPALDAYVSSAQDRSERIHIHYGVNQADPTQIANIIDKEFPDGIDVVIDDASHLYHETRASFCTAFPRLRPGGLYIVEDWGWAHWPDAKLWENPYFLNKPAVTNLLLELCIASASSPKIVDNVQVNSWMFAVRRGSKPLSGEFNLSSLTCNQGLNLSLG